MNTKKKPIFSEKDLGQNPLITNLEVKVSKVNSELSYYIGEDGIKYPKQIEMEYSPFVKLFKSSDNRTVINGLSDKAQRLYLWILQSVDCGKDYFWMNRDRYAKENDIKSPTTIVNAIKELHRYNIIFPSTIQNIYWVNPALFYCGNRIEKYKHKIVIVNEE